MKELIQKIVECVKVDYENMPENGFKNMDELFDYYRVIDTELLLKIHGEYYGEKIK